MITTETSAEDVVVKSEFPPQYYIHPSGEKIYRAIPTTEDDPLEVRHLFLKSD